MTPNPLVELMKQARALIDTPEKHTKGTFARNAMGASCSSTRDPSAVCFCSMGAVHRVNGGLSHENILRMGTLLDQAVHDLTGISQSIEGYNDTHTHAEVMEVWDRAIELAAQETT